MLWLWCRPAATALIQPLAWERPCTAGAATKRKKKKIKKKKKTEKYRSLNISQTPNCFAHNQIYWQRGAKFSTLTCFLFFWFFGFFCHVACFKMKIIKAPKTWEETLIFPLTA